MGERRIYEFIYSDFRFNLRRATKTNKKIDKSDQDNWKDYVRKHNVPEAAIFSRGKSGTMFGKLDAIIIDGMGDADGYYCFSEDEEYCLKFESGISE